jgi:hypothetical protein
LLGLERNPTTSYYLAGNIDLAGIKWTGPNAYAAHFKGNNKTIKLELSKTAGDTALFNSLAPGAIIEDLNVVVSMEGDRLSMTDTSHFGGVVGLIQGNGNYRLSNISVSGELKYNLDNRVLWLLAGGLIGEVRSNPTITIDNCDIDIKVDVETTAPLKGQSDPPSALGIGGLIGKIGMGGGNVTITNTRTAGEIKGVLPVNSTANDKVFTAGGLIGSDYDEFNKRISNETLTITNCYSAMDISITKDGTNYTPTRGTYAGGLIGYYGNGNTNSLISNSVALNPNVLAIAAGSDAAVNRVIGKYISNGRLSNNYALKGMITGTTGTGTANNEDGAEDGSDANGIGKTAAELSEQSFWTGLGFTTENWDFTGLNIGSEKYPTLKK